MKNTSTLLPLNAAQRKATWYILIYQLVTFSILIKLSCAVYAPNYILKSA